MLKRYADSIDANQSALSERRKLIEEN